MEIIGGSSASYLARTPCGNRRAFRLPGKGGEHSHCAVTQQSKMSLIVINLVSLHLLLSFLLPLYERSSDLVVLAIIMI